MNLSISLFLAFIFLVTGVNAQTPSPARFEPLVDYHQHLASPAGAELLNRSLPAAKVPADVDAFLKSFTDHWNDAAALTDLYTRDAVLYVNFRSWHKPWIQGNRPAAEYVAKLFRRPYAITPVIYSTSGNRASLSGYFTRGEAEKARHFALLYLELAKGEDGRWRIALGNRNFDPTPYYQDTISGEQLLKMMDTAGVKQAVLLSDAYWFDSPSYRTPGKDSSGEYEKVRAENDWTANEAAKSGGRLVAFCSFNPLADY